MKAIVTLARQAEEAGAESVWTADIGRDIFTTLTAIAQGTSRVRVGAAVAICFARPPAKEFAQVCRLMWRSDPQHPVEFTGRSLQIHGYRRFFPPFRAQIPIYFGGMNPQMGNIVLLNEMWRVSSVHASTSSARTENL